jgi:hypothetical protein
MTIQGRLGVRLKVFIFLYTLVLFASVASAEVYKWQDENGMHFTDSPSSVPEKYREKVFDAAREQIRNATPQARVAIPPQISPAVIQNNQAAQYQANLDQQRRTAEANRQQQLNAKTVENGFQSLARFLAFWVILGLSLFVLWLIVIVDIVTSEFKTSSNKTVWMLLVIFLPLLGMLLYMILGSSQKSNSVSNKVSNNEKQRLELLARLRPIDRKSKDFVIK